MGELLWLYDILLPAVQTKTWQPIVEKWPVVDREAYGILQYTSLLTEFGGKKQTNNQVSKMYSFGLVFFGLLLN